MVIDRYIVRLWLGPFVGGLILVLSVLLLGRSLKLLGQMSEAAEVWLVIGQLLVTTLPYFMLLTVPMAFFLSMQNTISSLQQNSEMDALRASGISYSRIFRSLLPVVCVLWLSLSYASMVLIPQGQVAFYNVLSKVSAMSGTVSFPPQRFTRVFDGVTVYVDGEDEQGMLKGVVMEDLRDGVSVLYTARSARFEMVGGGVELRMNNGVRFEGEGANQRMLSFDKYRVTLSLPKGKWKPRRSGDHVIMMTMAELWTAVGKGGADAIAEWNRRLLLPTTVLLLFFFTLPLSITQKRSGKVGSMILGIALLSSVYNLQLLLHGQVRQGSLPGWSMWAEQGFLLLCGMFLWKRTEEDRMPKIFSMFGSWMYILHQVTIHKLAQRLGKS